MTITYAIWQGGKLLSIDNKANNIKDVDKVIAELNSSEIAKKVKFVANVQRVEVKQMITLSCRLCDTKMSSDNFAIDDVITCPKCWDN